MRHSRGPGVVLPGGEGVFQIEKLREAAVLLLDRLREVDRLGVLRERIDRLLRDLRDVHRRDFLQLEDRNAGIDQLLQRHGDVLEADRLMADVEHDPDVPPQGAVRF